MPAKQVLDAVHTQAALARLDHGAYGAGVIDETPMATSLAEIETRDAYLATALSYIDDAVGRFMKIRLDHVLADDTSIGAPTRKVFAQTIASYEGRLDALADRVLDLAARGRAADPRAVADAVLAAARDTFADRDALRAGVLTHIAGLAAAGVILADHNARDTTLTEATRKRWSAARRDFEVLAESPDKIVLAPWAARIAAWPEQLDEPPPKPEVHPSDLIELD